MALIQFAICSMSVNRESAKEKQLRTACSKSRHGLIVITQEGRLRTDLKAALLTGGRRRIYDRSCGNTM